jgi:osmoprotectant transport system permease protein
VPPLAELNRMLAADGLAIGIPFGFANSYALAMVATQAASLGIARLSDLARHPQLRLGLSQEFLNRKDGWEALKAAYTMPFSPRGLDQGSPTRPWQRTTDVIDVYSTDTKIGLQAVVLEDDRVFRPTTPCSSTGSTCRNDSGIWGREKPRAGSARGHGRDERREPTVSLSRVAADFLAPGPPARGLRGQEGRSSKCSWRRIWAPDGGSPATRVRFMVLSVVAGVPLGIWAERAPGGRDTGRTGVLQTVPALALLAFLIAAFDRIGTLPAIVALFLYGLLPCAQHAERSTDIAGVEGVAGPGLPPAPAPDRRRAPRSMLAGIKTGSDQRGHRYDRRLHRGRQLRQTSWRARSERPCDAPGGPSGGGDGPSEWEFDLLDRWLVPAGSAR